MAQSVASEFFLGFICNCLSYFTTAKISFTPTAYCYICFSFQYDHGKWRRTELVFYSDEVGALPIEDFTFYHRAIQGEGFGVKFGPTCFIWTISVCFFTFYYHHHHHYYYYYYCCCCFITIITTVRLSCSLYLSRTALSKKVMHIPQVLSCSIYYQHHVFIRSYIAVFIRLWAVPSQSLCLFTTSFDM